MKRDLVTEITDGDERTIVVRKKKGLHRFAGGAVEFSNDVLIPVTQRFGSAELRWVDKTWSINMAIPAPTRRARAWDWFRRVILRASPIPRASVVK